MSPSKNNRAPRQRHKHTLSATHHPKISTTTPPHHHSQHATAAPSTTSYTWQDLRKGTSAKKKRATITTLETRGVKGGNGYSMAGGVLAGIRMGVMRSHHPLFLPQVGVPRPRGMRVEANRRNLHYVLLKTG